MIRSLIRRLNDLKLRDKMLLSFLLFMILPLVSLGVLLARELREVVMADAMEQAERGVDRLQRQTLDVLGVAINISDRLAADRNVENLLTTNYASSLEVFRAYHGFDTFHLYRDVAPEITGIQMYTSNQTILDNWEIRPQTEAVVRSPWFAAAQRHPNLNGWYSWTDETKAREARLSLVRFINYPSEAHQAVLVLDLDTSRIDSLLGQEGFETLVLDPNWMVIASSRPGLAGRRLTDTRLLALVSWSPAGAMDRSYLGQSSRVFLRDLHPVSTFNGLKIVCIVSPALILKPADRITLVGIAVTGSGTLVSLLFLWMVYTLFARRLENLSRRLPLVAAGDFDQVLPVDGSDEIGQLASRFNDMIRDIRGLMVQVKESHEARSRLERAQGEIRLKMLSSQINPHFLFNVLESIRMKAHLKGEREIANTVKLLGRLMRKNLEASGGPVTLGSELETVRCYLEIEKFRLEEKLEYQFEVGPGANEVLVPPLIIEPLVENSVVHGLQRQYGGGRVTVNAQIVEGVLEVSVVDDGMGMTPERLKSLFDQPEGYHIGLNNIHERLVLTYGNGSGLKVDSAVGEGTTVSFRIPLVKSHSGSK